ncbi:Dimethylsulfide dehydrogenase alpha subunit [gamma proteobacterium HdN1]|nr:Dimethylsulfide dehydrogenase alpha subunit [gamma proteobacterium HdN1]
MTLGAGMGILWKQKFDRRSFLKASGYTVAAAAAVELPSLHFKTALASDAATPAPLKTWEDLYRERWTWDRVVKSSHGWLNCRSACEWDIYVKDGVVVREEQTATYEASEPGIPDFNPRGCQKGACYTEVMYGPSRLYSPMKRVGERGSGQWEKISWDQALGEIAEKIVDISEKYGTDYIIHDMGPHHDFGPTTAARARFFSMLGASLADDWAEIGDLNVAATMTFGFPHVGGSSDEWFLSDYLVVWMMNPSVTQIPDAHFLFEAKYNGATLTVIDPQYSATAIHADHWMPIESGTDAALAMYVSRYIWENDRIDLPYVKEQTDLPMLVRIDNGRFLTEQDLQKAGRTDVVYYWDQNAGKPKLASGSEGELRHTRLHLDKDVDPAIEGIFQVQGADGNVIHVTTVGSLIRESLERYTLDYTAQVTKLSKAHITQFAKGFANAERPMILSSWGANRFFHSDLMNRAKILCLSLRGAIGKRGAGYHSTGWVGLEGFSYASMLDKPGLSEQIKVLYKVVGAGGLFNFGIDMALRRKTMQEFYREVAIKGLSEGEFCTTNSASINYNHQGIKEDLNRELEGHYPRTLDEYVQESQSKDWMPVPNKHKIKAWFTGGNNVLRRSNLPQRMLKEMWPNLELIVDINPKLTFTGMHADYLLPAAGYYEKPGFKYTVAYIPYLHYCDTAVPPIGDSKNEWDICCLLADKIQEVALARDLQPVEGCRGHVRDFRTFGDKFTYQRTYGVGDAEGVAQIILDYSTPTKGFTIEELKKVGAKKYTSAGSPDMQSQIYNEDWNGKGILQPLQHFVKDKYRWPTRTGRQQFYIDHPWFIEAGESMPCHKAPPKAGGDYPLMMVSCHARWSIHSVWRDTPMMLRLQRGEPLMYLNPSDAKKRNLADGDWGELFNDYGTVRMRIKVTAMVRPGVAYYYHAWEPYQFPNHESFKWLTPGLMKPMHFVGNYSQLSWLFGVWEPGTAVQDTRIDIRPWKEQEASA